MKNKELFYLALAIGGAFLIHKFMMKGMVTNIKATPVTPLVPTLMPSPDKILTQSSIESMALNLLEQSNITETALTNQHSNNEYNVASTYQTLYGRSISGMYKKCPTII